MTEVAKQKRKRNWQGEKMALAWEVFTLETAEAIVYLLLETGWAAMACWTLESSICSAATDFDLGQVIYPLCALLSSVK